MNGHKINKRKNLGGSNTEGGGSTGCMSIFERSGCCYAHRTMLGENADYAMINQGIGGNLTNIRVLFWRWGCGRIYDVRISLGQPGRSGVFFWQYGYKYDNNNNN